MRVISTGLVLLTAACGGGGGGSDTMQMEASLPDSIIQLRGRTITGTGPEMDVAASGAATLGQQTMSLRFDDETGLEIEIGGQVHQASYDGDDGYEGDDIFVLIGDVTDDAFSSMIFTSDDPDQGLLSGGEVVAFENSTPAPADALAGLTATYGGPALIYLSDDTAVFAFGEITADFGAGTATGEIDLRDSEDDVILANGTVAGAIVSADLERDGVPEMTGSLNGTVSGATADTLFATMTAQDFNGAGTETGVGLGVLTR